MARSSILLAMTLGAACALPGVGCSSKGDAEGPTPAGTAGASSGAGSGAGAGTTAGGASGAAGGASAGASGSTSGPGAGGAAGASVGTGGAAGSKVTFEATLPEVYVAKVKNLLIGLAPTDADIKAVKADPTNGLATLIKSWMAMPEYDQKMTAFFAGAFQQSQVQEADFTGMMGNVNGVLGANSRVTNLLLANIRQSFALTALQLTKNGQPFTENLTTTQFMMTPPLMAFYAFLDEHEVDDANKNHDAIYTANPKFSITAESSAGPIDIKDTLNPSSANYMHWYVPGLLTITDSTFGPSGMPGPCVVDPRVETGSGAPTNLWQIVMGAAPGFPLTSSENCNSTTTPVPSGQQPNNFQSYGQFQASDFTDWKMVTIRAPKTGEATTAFYDLPTLESTTELVLNTPRVGFYTTPAFLAGWNTNDSNSARVTTNQTLIVGLGAAFDGNYVPPSMPNAPNASVDVDHVTGVCESCHLELDPLRQFFRQAYSLNFTQQIPTDLTDMTSSTPGMPETDLMGVFDFNGVNVPGTGIGDFGKQMASHPDFAAAWVQKLCYYANSMACAPDDPEFLRLVTDFQSSKFSWSELVVDVMASPITTGATETKTFDENNGGLVPISRRDHWCAALSNRLGLTDVCQLVSTASTTDTRTEQGIAQDLPSDGYGRGSVIPVLANDPDMFFRSGVENFCRALADQVIDNAALNSKYTSANPTAALSDFVINIMGLTDGDPRAAQAEMVLTQHLAAAQAAPYSASAEDALKSTFVLACTSPSSVGLGL